MRTGEARDFDAFGEQAAALDREMEDLRRRLFEDQQRQREQEQAEEREADQKRAFQEQRRQRFAMQKCEQSRFDLPFIATSVAAIIRRAVDRVLTFGNSGLVIGAPGVDKTRALVEIVRRGQSGEGPEAALIEVSGISGNSTKVILDEVCARVGIEPAAIIADTERRLHRQVDYAPVLLFDEAQNLTLKPARVLLGIAEATGIPMLFCGNAEVLRLVSTKQAEIQQIARRLPIREEINCIMERDADLIADHFRVEDRDARQLCRDLGSMFHADGVARVLTQARHDIGRPDLPIGFAATYAALDVLPQFQRPLAEAGLRAAAAIRKSSLKPLTSRRG